MHRPRSAWPWSWRGPPRWRPTPRRAAPRRPCSPSQRMNPCATRHVAFGVNDTIWRRDSEASLVIRTDFAHEDAWTDIQATIVEPQTEDAFEAYVEFVDDKAYEGL